MVRLYLVRHGWTAWHSEERVAGWAKVPLDERGRAEADAAEQQAFLELCADPSPPDVLVFDGQYTPDEYARYRQWGHSRWTDAVQAAERVDAGRLFITHHDPDRDDAQLEELDAEVRAAMPAACLMRQGTLVQVRVAG